MTTNILMFYVIFSHVHLSNISFFFNVFLTQNYELQFSFGAVAIIRQFDSPTNALFL
jgi:hypothetical protein